MPSLVKHLFLLALALPTTVLGYHLVNNSRDGQAAVAARTLTSNVTSMPDAVKRAVSGFGIGRSYDLSDLKVLQRDLWYVETRYVEKTRLDPELMFQGALDISMAPTPLAGGKRARPAPGAASASKV